MIKVNNPLNDPRVPAPHPQNKKLWKRIKSEKRRWWVEYEQANPHLNERPQFLFDEDWSPFTFSSDIF